MIRIEFSSHAKGKLKVRRVPKRRVIQALTEPDSSYRDRESDALVAVKKVGDKHLVVVFASANGRVRVITVYFASDVDRLISRKIAERSLDRDLKLKYDSKEDILYLQFKDGPARSVEEVEDGVVAELDRSGKVMGIELWGVKKRGVLRHLAEITVAR